MSRAKVKIVVKPNKGGGNRNLIAKIPVSVTKNDHPTGQLLYQTKAQVSVMVKTTRNGKPRVSGRF